MQYDPEIFFKVFSLFIIYQFFDIWIPITNGNVRICVTWDLGCLCFNIFFVPFSYHFLFLSFSRAMILLKVNSNKNKQYNFITSSLFCLFMIMIMEDFLIQNKKCKNVKYLHFKLLKRLNSFFINLEKLSGSYVVFTDLNIILALNMRGIYHLTFKHVKIQNNILKMCPFKD